MHIFLDVFFWRPSNSILQIWFWRRGHIWNPSNSDYKRVGLVDCPTQLISSWMFIFLCFMTKLKEHSREISYGVLPPNMLLCCGDKKGVFWSKIVTFGSLLSLVNLCFWVQTKTPFLALFQGDVWKERAGIPQNPELVFLAKIGSIKEWVWYPLADQIPKVVFDSLTRNVFSTLHRMIDF